MSINFQKIVTLIEKYQSWTSLRKILQELNIDLNPDEIVKKILREFRNRIDVMYSVIDCEYYVKKKIRNNDSNSRIIMQEIVDKLRSTFKDLTPKPYVIDFLKSIVNSRWGVVYNQLLKDGVIEEINISGMIFVKINQ